MIFNIFKRKNRSYNKSSEFADKFIDLHIHSNYSDGTYTPKQIIELASEMGLKAISITDHDNISAIPKAMSIAKTFNIEFIPGIEISARYNNNDLHILGYYYNHQSEQLSDYVTIFQQERINRAKKIVEKLNKSGILIDFESVLENAKDGSIGRPHIAKVLIEQGCVKNHEEAFNIYIGDGCPCYVPKHKISPVDAIKLIRGAGGLSFVAHPGLDLNKSNILELIDMGIDGFETIHPKHSPQDTYYYRDIIKKYNLLECGGSDCHGDRKGERMLGKMKAPYRFVVDMKDRLKFRKQVN